LAGYVNGESVTAETLVRVGDGACDDFDGKTEKKEFADSVEVVVVEGEGSVWVGCGWASGMGQELGQWVLYDGGDWVCW
jgi:hypothetical protein